MEWSGKIDNKKYFAGTVVAAGLAAFAGKGQLTESVFLLGVVAASVANQWLMFVILGKLLRRMTDSARKITWMDQAVLWLQIGLKFSLLGGLFFSLIVYARHVVAQGLLLYTFQLIILVLSIKNIGAFLKKGSSE